MKKKKKKKNRKRKKKKRKKKMKTKDYEDKGLPGREVVYPGTKISKDPAVPILRQEQSAVQNLKHCCFTVLLYCRHTVYTVRYLQTFFCASDPQVIIACTQFRTDLSQRRAQLERYNLII